MTALPAPHGGPPDERVLRLSRRLAWAPNPVTGPFRRAAAAGLAALRDQSARRATLHRPPAESRDYEPCALSLLFHGHLRLGLAHHLAAQLHRHLAHGKTLLARLGPRNIHVHSLPGPVIRVRRLRSGE